MQVVSNLQTVSTEELALEKKFSKITTGTSLLDSIALALFAKFKEQTVSQTSSSEGLICTNINTFEPYP